MTARPWMPLYIADYLADTAHLGALESGAYLHLIMHYWQNDGLPTEDRHLARIARMTDQQWADARSTVAAFFQPDWTHKRIEKEMAKAKRVSRKRSASAKQRWSKTDANASAKNIRKDTQSQSHTQKEKKEPSQEVNSISRAGGPVRVVDGGRP